jgi:4-aminobutyrate aminotransferase-like enzyme/Ser/Thr protein kinase RdoA (MazF antagonist)
VTAEDRLIALRSAPPVFSIAEAERVAREVYGLAVRATSLSGERDANFLLTTADARSFTLKLIDTIAEPEGAHCQIEVLRHLEAHDATLPVPRVFATPEGSETGTVIRSGCKFATCLLAYLPGRMLADVSPAPPLLHDLGRMLARIDRALQGFFHPALAQPIAWDVRRLPSLMPYLSTIADDGLRASVAAAGEGIRERSRALSARRSQAIHGDAHGGNIVVDAAAQGITGILDFGDMIHAPLVLEPAVAMAEVPVNGVQRAEALSTVLAGYAESAALEAADIELLYDLIMARHAVTVLIHAWRVRHDSGADVLRQPALHSAVSLDWLQTIGREPLTRQWHEAAGTSVRVQAGVTLERRHRMLGAGAQLFYEQPLHLIRGSGVWLYDADDNAYLDVYNNVPHVGHCHPTVVRAVQRQVARLATHTRYLHGGILDYAEALTARCPPGLNACIFVNSGSEANDVAWRLAQFATGKRGALIMAHAYHGITDAVAALTPASGVQGAHDPRVVTLDPPAAIHHDESMTDEDLAEAAAGVDRALATLAVRGLAPAAFFLDTALTSSGIYDAPPLWMSTVAARLRSAGCLIVADEVQYGLGRSGSHFWGFERRGLQPDIVTLGKPIGNGFPMGAVIANRALIEGFQSTHGFFSTFGGNAVAASAGLAVLDVIDREHLLANAAGTGSYLRNRLATMAARHACLGRVRGTGLLLGLEVRGSAAATAQVRTQQIINAVKNHARVLIGYEGPAADILKLRPPLPFQPSHADILVAAIDEAAALVGRRHAQETGA